MQVAWERHHLGEDMRAQRGSGGEGNRMAEERGACVAGAGV
jgi:hypothetical protein